MSTKISNIITPDNIFNNDQCNTIDSVSLVCKGIGDKHLSQISKMNPDLLHNKFCFLPPTTPHSLHCTMVTKVITRKIVRCANCDKVKKNFRLGNFPEFFDDRIQMKHDNVQQVLSNPGKLHT